MTSVLCCAKQSESKLVFCDDESFCCVPGVVLCLLLIILHSWVTSGCVLVCSPATSRRLSALSPSLGFEVKMLQKVGFIIS